MPEGDNGLATRKLKSGQTSPRSIFRNNSDAESASGSINGQIRMGEVEQQLGNIDAVTTDIVTILSSVEVKLRPIMHQKGSGEDEADPPNEMVPLASKMQEQYMKLSKVRDRLQDILKEVDL